MKTRKKYIIKNRFRFITSLTVMVLILSFAISALFGLGTASGNDIQEYIQVQVQSGDTLWALAKKYGPSDMDCRRVVYEIEKINNVTPDTLVSGQILLIPVNSF